MRKVLSQNPVTVKTLAEYGEICLVIYYWLNTINGKGYVGQTLGTLRARSEKHVRLIGVAGTIAFTNALKKYGVDAFELTVLEICESQKALSDAETKWILDLNTLAPNGYNLKTGGSNGVLSEETRDKIARAHRGKKQSAETIEKRAVAHRGRKLSEESKKKIGDANRGKKRSPEVVKAMSERGKAQPVSRKSIDAMAAATRGRKLSPNMIKKISDGNRGLKRSAESRRNMSEAAKKRPVNQNAIEAMAAANRGKKRSPEVITKLKGRVMSDATIAKLTGRKRSLETRKRISDSRKGKPLSEQHRAALTLAHKLRKEKKLLTQAAGSLDSIGIFD